MERISPMTLVVLAIIVVVAAGFFLSLSAIGEREEALDIKNFEECAAAGYPIMESYPEQCRTLDGRTFVRDISGDTPSGSTVVRDGCAIAGCSGQLCVEAEGAEEIITTCEFRAEYACYQQFGQCERQTNGACGWTETEQLTQCLSSSEESETVPTSVEQAPPLPQAY